MPMSDRTWPGRRARTGQGLSVAAEKSAAGLTLRVAGEVTMTSSPALGEILAHACREHRGIIVDLTQVTAMDSAGIATLVEGLRQTRSPQKRFALSGVSQQIQDLLSLAKLEHAFPILSGTLPPPLHQVSLASTRAQREGR